jgi:DNA invertase Pin-like site-specific DNA recombinase
MTDPATIHPLLCVWPPGPPVLPPSGPLVAVYGRISNDPQNDAEGVRRQAEDALQRIATLGVEAEPVLFIDNDISASRFGRKKVRSQYQSMLALIRESRCRMVVVYKLDRLYRQPRELEELIGLAEHGAMRVETVTAGPIDLNTPEGRLVARMLVAAAANESENTSVRSRRQREQARQNGMPSSGPRPFGWRHVRDQVDPRSGQMRVRREPDPDEARLIREAIDAVISGVSLTEIARRWQDAGAQKPRGSGAWTATQVRQVLTNPRHIGMVGLRGEAVAQGQWQGIVDPQAFQACKAVLDSRGAATAGRPKRRSLLTGLVRCAKCGSVMLRGVNRGKPTWKCQRRNATAAQSAHAGCNSNSILAEPVELAAEAETIARFERGRLARRLSGKPEDAKALTAQLARLDAREDDLAKDYAIAAISRRFRDAALRELEQAREKLRAELNSVSTNTLTARYLVKHGLLAEEWSDLTIDQQRQLVADAVGRVTIGPVRQGFPRFDPSRVHFG